jgi:hypothetical protein
MRLLCSYIFLYKIGRIQLEISRGGVYKFFATQIRKYGFSHDLILGHVFMYDLEVGKHDLSKILGMTT